MSTALSNEQTDGKQQMLECLKQKIQDYMVRTGLTIAQMEKKAGLKPNAIRNILTGQSKNPGSVALTGIADVTGYTIPELFGREDLPPASTPTFSSSLPPHQGVNQDLLRACFQHILSLIEEETYQLTLRDITLILNEVYEYASRKNPACLDPDFLGWYVEKNFRGRKKA